MDRNKNGLSLVGLEDVTIEPPRDNKRTSLNAPEKEKALKDKVHEW